MVAEDNKHDYIELMTQYRLHDSIKEQLNSFLEGFHELIPKSLISIFDENELELVISGLPSIDLVRTVYCVHHRLTFVSFDIFIFISQLTYFFFPRLFCEQKNLEANTVYNGYQSSSENIMWFWATLRELSEQDRAKLLQFVTGTSKVSAQSLSFCIYRIVASANVLLILECRL